MARTNNLTNFLTDVSSAIKQKTGDNTPIPASDFDTEILSIETAGNYQSKTLNVTQNGNYNLLPDQDYDAMSNVNISVNVPTGEDLETEISAQEEYIAQLEAIIDTKSAGSGDGSSMNIFTQLQEPTIKKGIWLQKEITIDKIIADNSVFSEETWLSDGTIRDIPYNLLYAGIVAIGTNVYILGGINGCARYNYKYDTLTDTYTKMSDIPYDFYNSPTVAIGTDIYLLGSKSSSNLKNNYKYDTLTDTYTKMSDIPYDFYDGAAVAVGTDIFIFGNASNSDYYQYAYKYDTLTDTYTKMTDIPIYFYWSPAVSVGTNIYLLGGNNSKFKNNYKYDTLTDTYTKMSDIPFDLKQGAAVNIGSYIYLFGNSYTGVGGGQTTYKYDTSTDTYVQLTDIPYYFYGNPVVNISDRIYLFGGGNRADQQKVKCMQLAIKSYENNSMILSNGSTYKTELFSNPKVDSSVKYSFNDVFFYDNGLDNSIPTYYGNGTQWINIKNPPVEEVEE